MCCCSRRVLSKQPEAQQQDFPGPQWHSPFLAIFSFDFGWVVPVCTINYVSQYLLNTVALPLCLVGLVAITWKFQKDAELTDQEDVYYDMKANKRADYYFAFFLCCECWLLLSVTLLYDASEPVAGLAGLMRNVVCCV